MALVWYAADSADRWHGDIEVDLEKVGSPGGASWAAVTDLGEHGWQWSVYSSWLWEDLDTLAIGTVATLAQAQAAVTQWVAAARYREWAASA